MRIVFDVLGLLLLLSSIGACAFSKGAVQEAVGAALLIAAAVFLVGGALLKEAQEIKARLPKTPPQ